MTVSLSAGPNRFAVGGGRACSDRTATCPLSSRILGSNRRPPWPRRMLAQPPRASSQSDDSAASEMSVENALKVLGVSEGASFDDILRAKNSAIVSCKDDQKAVAQVEAAYDMLLLQSLSQRRAGKVVNSGIRYADVQTIKSPKTGSMPKLLQTSLSNVPISVEAPSTKELGVQAGVYGALIALTYVNGASNASAGVPGVILGASFGATLYFMTKKNVKLGKAAVITIGGLAAGAVVGSVFESWLQVDIIPFMGIHSPATVVSEFVIFSQLLISLYLR